jgi:hypothetical protein
MSRTPAVPSDLKPCLTCQAILIAVNRSEIVERGLLIFADDTLMAVVIHLHQSVSKEYRGLWQLESGFGPCEIAGASRPSFGTPDEAQQWVCERVVHARGR